MTAMLTAGVSIFVIATLAWMARKMLRVPICPICAGVAGTWLWMIVGRALGYPVNLLVLSILLGGSIAGIADQIEKRLPPDRSPLLWKTLFLPGGFVAAYALAASQWLLFAVTTVALGLLTGFFVVSPGTGKKESETVETLKKRLHDCC